MNEREIPAPIILKGQERTVTLSLTAHAADKSYPFKATFKRCTFETSKQVLEQLNLQDGEDEAGAEFRVLRQQLVRVFDVSDENHNLLDSEKNARVMSAVFDSFPYRRALIGGLFTAIHNVGIGEEQREGN